MLIHTLFHITSVTVVLLLDVYLEAVTFELTGSRLHTLLSYLVTSLRLCETSMLYLKGRWLHYLQLCNIHKPGCDTVTI